MPYYRRVGEVPAKRHTQVRAPDGRLYAEELMGTEGFSSSSALLYHRNPPTALLGAATVAAPEDDLRPNEPLLPRHLRTAELPPDGDLVSGRRLLLANDDVRLLAAAPTEASGSAVTISYISLSQCHIVFPQFLKLTTTLLDTVSTFFYALSGTVESSSEDVEA